MKVQFKHDVITETTTETDFVKIVAVVKEVHFYKNDGTMEKAFSEGINCLGMTIENGKVKFNRKLKFV
jgi:hypothetical protein